MNYLKKTAVCIAAILTAANSLGYIPYNPVGLPAFTAEAADIAASGECGAEGDNVKWQLDSEGTLTISGEGAMPDHWCRVEQIPWYTQNTFSKVVIEEGVTDIGDLAFAECKNLSSVTIPASVKSIGGGVFNGCESLSEITLPEGIDRISNSLFTDCSSLKSVVIPESVKSIGYEAFENCTSLEEIVIPEGVNEISGSAFNNSLWLKKQAEKNPIVIVNNILISGKTCEGKVVIPDTVTSINEEAFSENTDMTEIVIPDNVKNIGDHAFYSCGSLETITLPDTDIKIGNFVFNGCDKLVSVSLPDSITALPTGMFGNCHNLESIVIPDTVTEIGEVCFNNCHSLKEIVIQDSVKTIGNSAFENCGSLATITINNPDCTIYDSEITISNTAEIRGYANSTAQAYAEKYNRKFVSLGEKPAVEIVASGECGAEGDNVTWKLDGEGTLTISGTGEMSTTYFGEQELGKDENGIIPVDIKKVVIEDGVTSISGTAFNGYRMNEIEIADSVTSIGKFAFYNCPNLTEITLPKNLKEISLYAFTDCTALENITIPASVAVIGENPFYGCTSLNKIIVEDNNSDYVSVDGVLYTKDMTRIISYPIGKTLTEYNVPYTVKEIGGGAFGCETDLTNIIIPDSVTYIGEEAFSECNGITSITIPKNVANIGEYTFFKCAALEKIVIENPDCAICDYSYTICNTAKSLTGTDSKYQGNYDGTIYGYENSTAQEYAEKYSRKFVSLGEKPAVEIVASGECGAEGDNVKWQLDSEGTLTISGTGEMDSWALNSPWSEHSDKITKVIIEKGVTAIGEQAFADCTALTSATISDSVTSIGDYAFYSCDSLTTITIPDSVTSIGDKAFQYCENLTSINVDSENKNYVSEDGVLFNEDKSMLIHYPAGKTAEEYIIPDGVTSIVDEAFSGCSSLTTITIPNSVTSIGDKAFSDFTGLTTITIPDSVTSIGDEAFSDCISLTTITIPDSVTSIGDSVFCYCVSLTSITIPDSVTSIGSNAFTNCGSLATITINNPDCTIYDSEITISDTAEIRGYENSTAQAYAEKYNRKFVSLGEKPAVEIVASGECGAEGDDVKWQLDSEGTLTISGAWGGMYFHDNNIPWRNYQKDIVKVVVEKGVTGIEVAAFSYCTNLKSVTISDDIMYIGPYAFCGCTSLESIVIPDGVTDIEYSTFRDCINLTSVTLPESIIEIGHSAFEGCEKLASITLKNPECVIDDVENTIPDTTVIYGCENSEVQAYAEKYNIKFVALEDKPAAELGDVNEDGKVDSSDASLVLEEYAVIQTGGAGAFTENQKKAADVNNDGKTDSSDASKILEYYAMISTGKEPSWD